MKILNYILLIFSTSFLLGLDFSFDSLPIQESGRIKPIDSYARNQLLRFYGKTTLKNEALKSGLINEKDYDKFVNPKKMVYPS